MGSERHRIFVMNNNGLFISVKLWWIDRSFYWNSIFTRWIMLNFDDFPSNRDRISFVASFPACLSLNLISSNILIIHSADALLCFHSLCIQWSDFIHSNAYPAPDFDQYNGIYVEQLKCAGNDPDHFLVPVFFNWIYHVLFFN